MPAMVAEKGSNEDAGNLEKVSPVPVNCRAMLRHNIWAEQGLFNGAR